jgi:hypothetical protein
MRHGYGDLDLMPNLPDIPGKSLVGGVTRRARSLAGAAGHGALKVGGSLAKRALDSRLDQRAEDRRPAGPSPVPPPTEVPKLHLKEAAERESVPAPEPDKPKAGPPAKRKAPPTPKAKPPKPKAAKPKATKPPKPAKRTLAKPKAKAPEKSRAPAKATAKPKAKSAAEPGNISGDKEPHHALNSPIADPDATEYPDPFDKREDPRGPADPDGAPFGEEPHPPTGAESTSEPPPSQDPEVGGRGKPSRRDNLDD